MSFLRAAMCLLLLGCSTSSATTDTGLLGDGAPGGACAEGAACSTPRAMCSPDPMSESFGFLCVDGAYVQCAVYNSMASPGRSNGCPSTAPELGSACCRANVPGGVPHGCSIAGAWYECQLDHWALRE